MGGDNATHTQNEEAGQRRTAGGRTHQVGQVEPGGTAGGYTCGHGRKPQDEERTPMTDDEYRQKANDLFASEEIEIETADARISRGSDPGAWVAAWVWVPNGTNIASDQEEDRDQ